MLGREKKPNQEIRAPMAKPEQTSNDAAISLIAQGMKIVGDCETDGTIRVEGRIEGTLRAGKSVVVGRGGEVTGDIITQDAVISGRVNGNIVAESRLELQATCDIQGEIRSRRVQLDEGARFNGQVHMEDPATSGVIKSTPKPTVGQPAVQPNVAVPPGHS
jgi:cytoskeletal protein CcmA (bactofilin family)